MLTDTTASLSNEQSSGFATPSSEMPETNSTSRVTDEGTTLPEATKQAADVTSQHVQSTYTGHYEYYQQRQ